MDILGLFAPECTSERLCALPSLCVCVPVFMGGFLAGGKGVWDRG